LQELEQGDSDESAFEAAIKVFAGFVVICAAIIMGLYLPSLQNPFAEELKSRVDPICKPLWLKNAQNDQALRCYLQKDIARLCNSDERKHLAATIIKYRRESDQFQADMVKSITLPRVAVALRPGEFADALNEAVRVVGSADGTFESRTRIMSGEDPTGSDYVKPYEPQENGPMQRLESHFQEDVKRYTPSTLEAALNLDLLPRDELVAALRSLGETGYVRAADFGWFADSLVSEAFVGVDVPISPCKKP
jgi:hypothetical protein